MSEQKYAFEDYDKNLMAKAFARDLSISTKKTIEVCAFIKGKTIRKAREALNRVLKFEDAIPYKRFMLELAHNQRGPSGYPIKPIKAIMKLMDAVEANAKSKGLHADSLEIIHMCAHRGGKRMHYGRKRGITMKRTHVEIVVKDMSGKPALKTETKAHKVEAAAEEHKEAAKEEKKEAKSARAEEKTESHANHNHNNHKKTTETHESKEHSEHKHSEHSKDDKQ